jgi:hypothetical protein
VGGAAILRAMAVTLQLTPAALALLGVVAAVAHEMPRGCHAVTNHDVLRVPHGYLIPGLNRFVRDEDAIRSGSAPSAMALTRYSCRRAFLTEMNHEQSRQRHDQRRDAQPDHPH